MEPKYRATITLTSQPGQAAPDSHVELRGPWGAVKVHDPHTCMVFPVERLTLPSDWNCSRVRVES